MTVRIHNVRRERGYVLLALLLVMSLLVIGFLVILEGVDFQIKRDREEEFIHRGAEYSRAVHRYVKKFGRYPTSIDALENSNNLHFLRKRYKDPITGKEFKLLHFEDVGTFHQPNATFAAGTASPKQSGPPAQTTNAPATEAATEASNTEGAPSTDLSATSQADPAAVNEGETSVTEHAGQAESGVRSADIDGKAIVGVTSYSKHQTIRVFNRKNHYNEWQFFYDPSNDMGLVKGPNQPLLKGAGQIQPLQNGQGSPQDSGTNNSPK